MKTSAPRFPRGPGSTTPLLHVRLLILSVVLGTALLSSSPSGALVRDPPIARDSTSLALRRLHPEAEFALRYTPTIHLATDETVHPMMPHAFAFDGIDDDGDGLVDLEDTSELAPGMLDLRTVSRLYSARRPLRASIQQVELARSILDHAANDSLDAWPLPRKTREALRTAGIVLSPRAYCIERAVSPTDSVPVYIVDPERWTTLSAGLSKEIRAASTAARGPQLPARLTRRLRDAGVPLAVASVRWTPRPNAPEGVEGGIYFLHGVTPWGIATTFSLYPESGRLLDVYYGADSTNAEQPGLARFVDVRRDSVVRGRLEVAATVPGAILYEVAVLDGRLDPGDALWLTRIGTPPEPRVGYVVQPEPRTGGHRISYWLYFLYDIGTGAHVHDAEQAIVYTDAIGDVVAFAANAHGDAAAGNILLRDRLDRLEYQRPQQLPKHMSLLVELGKHALAPDRNDDGRFDLGMDANYLHRSAWGQRDLNAAFGSDAVGEFRSEYSFPRSNRYRLPHRLRVDADRAMHPLGPAEEQDVPLPWGDVDAGMYSLYPAADYDSLYALLAADSTSRRTVLDFLIEHKHCFWGARENYVDLPREIPANSWRLMRSWPKRSVVRRDFWTHRGYEDPDRVFKPWLFPRLALLAGIVQRPPSWLFPIGLQVPAPRSPFAIETVRLMIDQNPQLGEFQDLRLMLSSGRGAMRAVSGGIGRAGALSDPPQLLFMLEYSPVQALAPEIGSRRFRLSPIGGVRTVIGSGPTDWRIHLGLQVETPLVPPIDPLELRAD